MINKLFLTLFFVGSCSAMNVEKKVEGKDEFTKIQESHANLKQFVKDITKMENSQTKQVLLAAIAEKLDEILIEIKGNLRDCTVHNIKLFRRYNHEARQIWILKNGL